MYAHIFRIQSFTQLYTIYSQSFLWVNLCEQSTKQNTVKFFTSRSSFCTMCSCDCTFASSSYNLHNEKCARVSTSSNFFPSYHHIQIYNYYIHIIIKLCIFYIAARDVRYSRQQSARRVVYMCVTQRPICCWDV